MKRVLFIISLILLMSFNVFAGVTIQWEPLPSEENVETYTVYWYKTDVPEKVYNKSVLGTETTLALPDEYFEVNADYTFYARAFNSVKGSFKSVAINLVARENDVPPTDNLPDPIILDMPSTVTINIVNNNF